MPVLSLIHVAHPHFCLARTLDDSLCFICFTLLAGCWKCGLDSNGNPSCCGRGGTWEGKCGRPGVGGSEHTWGEGLRSCATQTSSKSRRTCTCLISCFSMSFSITYTRISIMLKCNTNVSLRHVRHRQKRAVELLWKRRKLGRQVWCSRRHEI